MKTWKVVAVGMLGMATMFLLPLYERLLAGATAVIVVAAVATGFFLGPRKEVFVIRITSGIPNPDHLVLDNSQLALKVELAALSLLFLPTFLAVGLLVATAAKGTTCNFGLFGQFAN